MKNRIEESLAPLFDLNISQDSVVNLLLLSPSDVGVMRNKGRNGARFAPRAIINQLKKYNNHSIQLPIRQTTVSSQTIELDNFDSGQEYEKNQIAKSLKNKSFTKCLHIGGGHDHIYPLLHALEMTEKYDNILVLNIDAHCDTRVDTKTHSGTPFRDFSKSTNCNFHLIQFGIQDFANSPSTISPLPKGKVEYMYFGEVKNRSNHFTKVFDIFENVEFELKAKRTAIVLSLDCDGIDGSSMKAVSAVNPKGIPAQFISEIILYLKNYSNDYFFGVYELNPIFEDQSLLSIKTTSSLIYDYLK